MPLAVPVPVVFEFPSGITGGAETDRTRDGGPPSACRFASSLSDDLVGAVVDADDMVSYKYEQHKTIKISAAKFW